ncbi:MAG: GNAT family N-acetyltransferase [Kordiimonadaceae bacterium]|jgi:RimJ/RimL family protein N-acetyltransferase|nr:GNAT family N-acetyltransferase [Kordiimonadaceae bacterium]MBT6035373.1 GNAT family N-acetyltransferase [Kordiimonadaceae bacterium]MBT7583313.1 GNAT family N-acetyltransferase [Kordiimonadaceae bacterium]
MTEEEKEKKPPSPRLSVDEVTNLDNVDILELCETTRVAILAHEGFNWLTPPAEKTLESFWKSVFIIPERTLIIARMEGQIAGCCQLVRPPKNNEAGAFRGNIETFFLAPWARGHNLAKTMLRKAEDVARAQGCRTLECHMASDQQAAIAICEWIGMDRWGIKERYARINDVFVPGYYYSKDLD